MQTDLDVQADRLGRPCIQTWTSMHTDLDVQCIQTWTSMHTDLDVHADRFERPRRQTWTSMQTDIGRPRRQTWPPMQTDLDTHADWLWRLRRQTWTSTQTNLDIQKGVDVQINEPLELPQFITFLVSEQLLFYNSFVKIHQACTRWRIRAKQTCN